jgi:predicted phosphodiesterase
MELFVARYKVAHKHKWTREELSSHLGIKKDSLRRRKLTVLHVMGLALPDLKDGEYNLTGEKISALEDAVKSITEAASTSNEAVTTLHSEERPPVGIYVITSAQNSTPVHRPFLSALLNYCEHRDAKLMVIPYRYKNPTSIFVSPDKQGDIWDKSITPYMTPNTVKIAENLVLVGSVKIQPTAVQPLSGFEGYTGKASAILGHPRVQLKTVPTPSTELPKILASTGAVTIPNYTDSKAGFKGNFHHSLAAIVVEVTETEFHMRHIHGNKETGEFYDLDSLYESDNVTTGHRVSVLVTGDTHAAFLNKDVEKATYSNEDSIVNVLRPEVRIFHDLNDFRSRNHHDRGNDLMNVAKHLTMTDDVEAELQIAADLLDRYNDPESLNVIVKSNHDEALDRWLREATPTSDPRNAKFFYYLKYHQLKNMKTQPNGRFETIDPFEFWCHNPESQRGLACVDNTVFLQRDQSIEVNGIELGFHGDSGPNGARGSIQNLSKIGAKLIVGHSHSPGIFENVYQVGTSSDLDMGYNKGPSSWMTTHALVYPDGKRTLINVINGRWRG